MAQKSPIGSATQGIQGFIHGQVTQDSSTEVADARHTFLGEMAQKIHESTTPYKIIAIMAEVPSMRMIGWQHLMSFAPSADLLHHLLAMDEVSEMAREEIGRLRTIRQN